MENENIVNILALELGINKNQVKNTKETKFVVCTIDFAAGYGTLKLRCYAREKGKHPGGLR